MKSFVFLSKLIFVTNLFDVQVNLNCLSTKTVSPSCFEKNENIF